MITKFISRLLLFVAIAGISIACTEETKQEKVTIRPIKYQTVTYTGGEQVKNFSGKAQTDKVINLSFRSTGIITRYNMKLGQKVRKGQVLAKLDNVQARLAYEQAVNQVNSAASQMNTAELNLNRVRTLYEKGSTALSNFEAAKNEFRTAEESYQSAKRGVAIQQEQVRYGTLYAPSNGVIATINAEVDENVGAGQVIATLNAGKQMEIVLGIPENTINNIHVGMKATVAFPALEGKQFEAEITEVAPAVDANTATYLVRVGILKTTADIKGGMAANVTLALGNKQETTKKMIVPANAVGEDSNGNYVFLVDESGEEAKVKKHQVAIGKLSSEGFEIISGLKEGDKIATAGLQTLLDGQLVKLP